MSPESRPSLEQFIHHDRIDIGRLTIENPKPTRDIPFDAERDITKGEWEGMKRILLQHRANKQWRDFSILATRLYLLFPNRQAELELNAHDWDAMKQEIDGYKGKNVNYGGRARFEMNSKILFPDRQTEIDTTESEWKIMSAVLDKQQELGDWMGFVELAVRMKVIFSERQEDLKISNQVWEKMLEQLKRHRNFGDLHSFVNMVMYMRLLCPDRQEEIQLTDQDWEKLKNIIDSYHNMPAVEKDIVEYKYWELSRLALFMQILSAERAEITDKGEINITMPKRETDLHQEKTPIPLRRNF